VLFKGIYILQTIKRRFDLLNHPITNMCVDFGCFAAFMAKQFLDIPDVGSGFQQVSSVTVPQPVQGDRFVDARLKYRFDFRFVQYRWQAMFPAGVVAIRGTCRCGR